MSGGVENRPPTPSPIGPTPPWVMILASVFGGATLLGFFVFAYISGQQPDFICNSFPLLAAIFALGAALAAGFIGGAAAINGALGSKVRENAIWFSAGGGIAVLFLAFWAFHYFKGDVCRRLTEENTTQHATIQSLNKDIQRLKDTETTLQKRFVNLQIEAQDHAKKLRERDIVIWIEGPNKKDIVVEYYSKDGGGTKRAKRDNNQFKIPYDDVDHNEPGFLVRYDATELPPERQNKQPPPISIERMGYNAEPLLIRLWVNAPQEGWR